MHTYIHIYTYMTVLLCTPDCADFLAMAAHERL